MFCPMHLSGPARFLKSCVASSLDPAPSNTAALAPKPLPQATVWLMAVTVAVIVANIYYIQPLLEVIAHDFHLTVERAGALAMLSQVGTALGMLFFVPLGTSSSAAH